MGRVSLALDQETSQFVAVKRLHEAVALQGGVRLRREFKSLERIEHENVVKVLALGEENGIPFLVMEFVRGTDLNDWLKENPPLEKVIHVFAGVASALSAVHAQGIVHRDLKPENIRVTETGNAKLMDFGLAKTLEGSVALTREGAVVGTVLYMAPEQCRGQQLDYRADLYAMGAVLFSALTGKPPFTGEGIVQVIMQHIQGTPPAPRDSNPNVPESLNALVLQLLAKNPLDRPQNALALKEALLASLASNLKSTVEISNEIARADAILIAPLIGRDTEVMALNSFLESETGLIAITGDVGVGKTRLLRALSERLQGQGKRLVTAEAIVDDPTPFGTISRLIASLGKHHGNVIENLSDNAKGELGRISSRLGFVPASDTNLPPEVARLKLFEAFTELLEGISQTSILAFENLHWADSSTLELLAHSSRALENTKIIISYRLEDLPEHSTYPKGLNPKRTIHLEPLTEPLTLELLRALMDDELDPALEVELVSRAGGNPWVLEERLKAMLESGAVYRRAGVYEWNRNLTGLPETLGDLLNHRITALPQPALEFARAASVLGRAFLFEDARALLDWSDDAALDALETLVRAKLVIETPGTNGEGFRFTHPSYAELLEIGLMSLKRRRLHAKAATLLETRAAPLELTEHYLEAALYERTLEKGLEAGLLAQNTFAYPQAERAYRMALTASEKLESEHLNTMIVRNQLGEVLSFAGRNDEAISLWKIVMENAELLENGSSVASSARVNTAKVLRARGEFSAAISLLGEPNPQDSQFTDICIELCQLQISAKNFGKARQFGLHALKQAKLEQNTTGFVQALVSLAVVEREKGLFGRAIKILEVAISAAEKVENHYLLSIAHVGLGNIYVRINDHENAFVYFQKAEISAQKSRNIRVEIGIKMNLALLSMYKSNFLGALDEFLLTKKMSDQFGFLPYSKVSTFNIATCKYALGELIESREIFSQIKDHAYEMQSRFWEIRITLELGDGFVSQIPMFESAADKNFYHLLEAQLAISYGDYVKAYDLSSTEYDYFEWEFSLIHVHSAWRLNKLLEKSLEIVLNPEKVKNPTVIPENTRQYAEFVKLVLESEWTPEIRDSLKKNLEDYKASSIGLLARDVALSLVDEAKS
jgi:serine/threonine protein kinase/tetratricopeptide (TPR) repeat protein